MTLDDREGINEEMECSRRGGGPCIQDTNGFSEWEPKSLLKMQISTFRTAKLGWAPVD